jgi:hypothetical protein
MVDIRFPIARPVRWRVPDVLVVLAFVMLLAMNWSAVLVTAQSLYDDSHNCRTKLGRAADRVVSFVLHRGPQCETQDPFPLGIP